MRVEEEVGFCTCAGGSEGEWECQGRCKEGLELRVWEGLSMNLSMALGLGRDEQRLLPNSIVLVLALLLEVGTSTTTMPGMACMRLKSLPNRSSRGACPRWLSALSFPNQALNVLPHAVCGA